MLIAKPVSFKEACEYIKSFHRHHKPPQGWKFGIAAYKNDQLVGVICVGRPVSRHLDNGLTCEVTRLCTNGERNVCSFLYARARKAAFALGYNRIITYILEKENGSSLKAAGFSFVYKTSGGSWNSKSRPRIDKAPTCPKQLWESIQK